MQSCSRSSITPSAGASTSLTRLIHMLSLPALLRAFTFSNQRAGQCAACMHGCKLPVGQVYPAKSACSTAGSIDLWDCASHGLMNPASTTRTLMLHAGTGRLNGRSEQLLGRFIAEYPGSQATRDGVLVATKLAAYPWRITPGQYVAACRCLFYGH